MRPVPRLPTCSVLGLILLLVVPAAAQAAQKSVDMGLPRASQRAFQSSLADVNDFFPHRVTIRAGDTVRFVPTGFHTVNLPARGGGKLPLIIPTGQKVAGAVDAAGAPFFFNGLDQVGFNPRLLTSNFGKRRTYTGRSQVLSGLPLARRPQPMTVRFDRTGTFRYFCDLHLGMTGVVKVVGSDDDVPSAREDRATLRDQVASTLRTARSLVRNSTQPANTVDVGLGGAGRVSFFGFAPARLTVPTGTTVTFREGDRSETHTATIGPGNPETQPSSYLGQLAGSLESPTFDPRAVYPSDPGPAAPFTPTFHGNGFWNSGAMDLDPGTPLRTSNTVRFSAPGTYEVWCLIHPFMRGTVTVQ
jgi:plastocyanin